VYVSKGNTRFCMSYFTTYCACKPLLRHEASWRHLRLVFIEVFSLLFQIIVTTRVVF
jgi:hypothetical protein